jgi:hypothetical protein
MITGNTYFDMLENFAILQLEEGKAETFEHDGAPLHYSNIICWQVLWHWIGTGG